MAAPARRVSTADAPLAAPKSALRLAEENDLNTPSPALAQQALIASLWSAPPTAADVKWSPRRTLLFVVLTCGGFWTAAAYGVLRLLR